MLAIARIFRFLLLTFWIVVPSQPAIVAEEFAITPESDVQSMIQQVRAGDSIVLKDGTWLDAKLKFEGLSGTAAAPISIRSQTPGGVVFSGATEFRCSGEFITVSGFMFRNPEGVSDVLQLRTHSERHARHCRVTDCAFEQTAASSAGSESRWLSVYGTQNRIDHCSFTGKQDRGTTLVVWVTETAGHHRIDHNQFGPRPELGRNGGETIRIGTSEVSELVGRCTVENNYFHQCNGEAEIVSNKSCENIYRHNVFDECSGALTLRHGHRCIVDANVFLGNKQPGTGGVRIIGSGHFVTNNYFEGLRGDAERAAICLMNGVPTAELNSYAPVDDALIAHNTMIDCKVSMEFGVGAGKKQSAVATNCRFLHNVLDAGKWPVFRVHAPPVDATWEGNKVQLRSILDAPFAKLEPADLQFERGTDGLLRPATPDGFRSSTPSTVMHDIDGQRRGSSVTAGCDEPGLDTYAWPSALNTGTTWR